MEEQSAYSLIQKFQQLQEERVHVYKIFQEGHKIYLNTAPNYNFIRFRALVQDVTQVHANHFNLVLRFKSIP